MRLDIHDSIDPSMVASLFQSFHRTDLETPPPPGPAPSQSVPPRQCERMAGLVREPFAKNANGRETYALRPGAVERCTPRRPRRLTKKEGARPSLDPRVVGLPGLTPNSHGSGRWFVGGPELPGRSKESNLTFKHHLGTVRV